MQIVNEKISIEREGRVLVVNIDNPPINAGSLAVRSGLMQAIRILGTSPDVDAAVLIGRHKTFIAGSDLREFGQPLEEPQLPAVIRAIELVDKPVVAALDGAALGGGFELALGCDARIATPSAIVGLPEVTLGMIPGAGGTQRLPRLIGVARSIDMICSGERMRSPQAHALSIIDKVAQGDLRAEAVAFAAEMKHKRRVRDSLPPADQEGAIARAKSAALRGGRTRPNVAQAIERVEASASEPVDVALAREREIFQTLRVGEDAFALRHVFFSEREAAKQPGDAPVQARPFARIAVIGGGTMGSGIAICCAQAGLKVDLIEQPDAIPACNQRLDAYWRGRVEAGKCTEAEATASRARVGVASDWNVLRNVDLMIEAVFEEIAVKIDVFRKADVLLRPGATMASNTSYLDLDAIAASVSRPGDVVGLHFFSPAPVMKLLEIVRGSKTDEAVLATAFAFARKLSKQPVVARNGFGFVGNRIFDAYRRQCEFLLEEGALPYQVDAALEAFGFALGPFAVADMSGLDVAWRMRKSRAHLRDPKARYVGIADELCEAGRLGRKAQRGWYRYDAGSTKRQVDPEVTQLIETWSRRRGLIRRTIDADEIVRRAVGAIVNEALHELQDGTAARPGDIDVALIHGYGFPRWRGGPLWWARQQGASLERLLDEVTTASGPGHSRATVDSLR